MTRCIGAARHLRRGVGHHALPCPILLQHVRATAYCYALHYEARLAPVAGKFDTDKSRTIKLRLCRCVRCRRYHRRHRHRHNHHSHSLKAFTTSAMTILLTLVDASPLLMEVHIYSEG
ncbi:hypothetical protein E2C01_019072 [Portunus trituberculatus]|uniref:Uncharacterized protein n=1 Tax=Portunus trituberculatus TaxID=210409 RepID=A0A5B7DWX8_PORTR|nr:hypothetical protein [Portunus trituberculatus]